MLNQNIDRFLDEVLHERDTVKLHEFVEGYRLSAKSEGKSPNTFAIVEASVRYLDEFLVANNLSTNVGEITAQELRRFIVYLKGQPRFAHHRFTRPQDGHLSGYTINGYMRALQAFWSWLERENFIQENPFTRLKIPKAPKKVIPIFTEEQLHRLFAVIDIMSPVGYRDYAIILTLLDTGIRCSELTNLKLTDVNLESRLLKVWGKGSKERIVPIGALAQKMLWRYTIHFRPEPLVKDDNYLFLALDGKPLRANAIKLLIKRWGKKAGIPRLHAHLCRHTFATNYLTHNCGDVFRLQQILGHNSLEMVRRYVHYASTQALINGKTLSPVDQMGIRKLRGYRIDQMLSKTGHLHRKDRNG